MPLITHITPRANWEAAQVRGAYRAASLDSEGFIHFSTPQQLGATANRFYRGQTHLVLLVVDTDRLTADLRYESPTHETIPGEQFPHLYGELNLDAVTRVIDFPPNPDGTFAAPDSL